jgi:glycosyltransferase involved in cell wall biosynthesis
MAATHSTPRRVLFVAWAPFFSGAERALVLTLGTLDPARYTPCVLAGTDGEFASQVRGIGVPCEVASLRHVDRRHPLAAARSIAAVFRAARRHRVSLIHSNDMPSFQPGGYAAMALRIPTVTHMRFPDTRAGYQWFLRGRFSLALFVSRNLMMGALKEAPDIFGGRSEVLYDCVEPQEPWSENDTARCRQELGLPVHATIVAITGQIADIKGIWDFLEAARILAGRGPDPLFVVLGDDLKNEGRTRRAMEERVDATGLKDRFKFLGFRRDAPRVVQAFDIIAVPSLVEPLGNATLEAMASGRPVVGTRVGGIPEMVVEGETGLLVPPASPDALAAAIGELVHDPALRARMSAAARRRASDVFGGVAHGTALQGHYDTMCAGVKHHREG